MRISIDVAVMETDGWGGPRAESNVSLQTDADAERLPWEAICQNLVQTAIEKFKTERQKQNDSED